MKNFIKMIGLITLICGSFFITEKTALVINDLDSIMIDIKQNKDDYEVPCKDAVINGNYIIPGISGKKVNVKQSYKIMRSIGIYSDNYFVYDKVMPNVSITTHKELYITKGNSEKRMVSLLFLLTDNEDADSILNVLTSMDIPATFFVTDNWVDYNNSMIASFIDKGHTVGNLGHNFDYSYSSSEWLDTIIRKINKQNDGYCLTFQENQNVIDNCLSMDNYTIIPSMVIQDNLLFNVKKELTSGSIIAFYINSKTISELSSVISYIESKGFSIVNLEELLTE